MAKQDPGQLITKAQQLTAMSRTLRWVPARFWNSPKTGPEPYHLRSFARHATSFQRKTSYSPVTNITDLLVSTKDTLSQIPGGDFHAYSHDPPAARVPKTATRLLAEFNLSGEVKGTVREVNAVGAFRCEEAGHIFFVRFADMEWLRPDERAYSATAAVPSHVDQ